MNCLLRVILIKEISISDVGKAKKRTTGIAELEATGTGKHFFNIFNI